MMVSEYGGQTGVSESERDLHLFSLISPSWIKLGKKVAIRNAPTEMGPVSATLAFTFFNAHAMKKSKLSESSFLEWSNTYLSA